YIYKGKKFNAHKEMVDGDDYYGIKIFRFHIKRCVVVSSYNSSLTESHPSLVHYVLLLIAVEEPEEERER
ncbi:hypothetical protein EV424DRAFT_1322158, partial [Suillus variegatus]